MLIKGSILHTWMVWVLLMATRNPANSPVEVGSLSHYLQGCIHPRWLFGISEPSTVLFSGFLDEIQDYHHFFRLGDYKLNLHLPLLPMDGVLD